MTTGEKWREAIKTVEQTIVELQERDRRRSAPAKILLVDDDPNDICLLCRLLSDFLCEVEICRDAPEAELMLTTRSFDIVFLDQKLPTLTGLDILKKTLPIATATQFFMVSGFQNSSLINETLKLGAIYLPKPVTRRILATFLRAKNE